jgi:hypothetical protein
MCAVFFLFIPETEIFRGVPIILFLGEWFYYMIFAGFFHGHLLTAQSIVQRQKSLSQQHAERNGGLRLPCLEVGLKRAFCRQAEYTNGNNVPESPFETGARRQVIDCSKNAFVLLSIRLSLPPSIGFSIVVYLAHRITESGIRVMLGAIGHNTG